MGYGWGQNDGGASTIIPGYPWKTSLGVLQFIHSAMTCRRVYVTLTSGRNEMATQKQKATLTFTPTTPVADVLVPVVTPAELYETIKAAKPGVGGIVWEGWTGQILAQGVYVSNANTAIWYTIAAGAWGGGLRAGMLKEPSKKEPNPVWEEMRARIIACYKDEEKTALAVSGRALAALGEDQLKARARAIDRLKENFASIRKHLKNFEKGEARGTRTVRTPDEIVHDMIADTVNYMRKAEHEWVLDFGTTFDTLKSLQSDIASDLKKARG